ncbi:MAG: hydrogenase maturation protease [Chloroflexi bacterium]|nr:hydrogenase maturation protease [Chloroflexota bacterium]
MTVSTALGRRPLVVGYGNPLRADDGFGWQAATRLAGQLSETAARVLAVHQLTPELAEDVAQASLVVFLDIHEGGQPGVLIEQALEGGSGQEVVAFSHDVDAEAILFLAETLYGHRPPATMLSVGGSDFSYAVGLSPPVDAALPVALDRVRSILRSSPLDRPPRLANPRTARP